MFVVQISFFFPVKLNKHFGFDFFLLLVCLRKSMLESVGNMWWMKKEEWQTPYGVQFHTNQNQKFKANEIKNRIGWFPSQIKHTQVRQIAPFFFLALVSNVCDFAVELIDANKFNQTESVRSNNNSWEPPIIQQKNSRRFVPWWPYMPVAFTFETYIFHMQL